MSDELDPNNVPDGIAAFLPLAAKWGIGDDVYRVDAVWHASDAELLDLINTFDALDDSQLWDWLAGPEANNPNPTAEYLAITCLTMAIETAESVLKDRRIR